MDFTFNRGRHVATPTPPQKRRRGAASSLLLPAVLAVGVLAGLGSFTFVYGKGYTYLSNDPAACANGHVMQGHFDAWQNSSHARVATCNDCHLLHDPTGKWITKGDNGFFHSLAFTTHNFHEPIRIKPRNRVVTQKACLYCHEDLVHALGADAGGEDMLCARCHTDVGHAHR